jgi:hypothetical protein
MTWCALFFLFFGWEQESNIDDMRRVSVSSIDRTLTTTLCCYFLVARSYYTPGIWYIRTSFSFSVGVSLRVISRIGILSPRSPPETTHGPDCGIQQRFGQSRNLSRGHPFIPTDMYSSMYSPGTSCTHPLAEPLQNPEDAPGSCPPPYRERLDTLHVLLYGQRGLYLTVCDGLALWFASESGLASTTVLSS